MKGNLTKTARDLRNNGTEAEKYLWYMLRLKNFGVKFRRQTQIGRFIVDFVSFEKRLIVEIDGGQHADNEDDQIRDKWLRSEGYEILRFWNHDVLKNREGVLEKIKEWLNSPIVPLPNPPHKGEETDLKKLLTL